MKEAMFYEKLDDKRVKCNLCHQNCMIPEGSYGFCNARKNEEGVLYSEVYGHLTALNIDPVEKKPLYHFMPGSKALSIGTCGCNFRCSFCQNYRISQVKTTNYPRLINMSPEEVVEEAVNSDCDIIAYTYNEPTINYEFALEASKIAEEKGLKNVFVTNGYIQKEPLERLEPYLHAANIDLKSSNPDFYKKFCKADLNKVLNTIKNYYEMNIHLELTTLIVPGANDSKEEIKRICDWIITHLDNEVPLHFSRFHPCYKMRDRKPTSLDTIKKAVETAKQTGLKHVYAGNVRSSELSNTYCPSCNSLLIKRSGYAVSVEGLQEGVCEKCGERLLEYY